MSSAVANRDCADECAREIGLPSMPLRQMFHATGITETLVVIGRTSAENVLAGTARLSASESDASVLPFRRDEGTAQ